MASLGDGRARLLGGVSQQKAGHRGCDLGAAVGANIRPAQRLVAVEHGALDAREPVGGTQAHLKSRAVFAGDHQHALGERRERRRIEPHRRTQHDPAEPFGMLHAEAGDIGRDLRCDMRLADPEMIEQRQKALGGGHVPAHATTPTVRNAAISSSE